MEARCITYGVLCENDQRTLEEGVLHRAFKGVYSGIKSGCMRQIIGEVVGSAGYVVTTAAKNYKEAEKAV